MTFTISETQSESFFSMLKSVSSSYLFLLSLILFIFYLIQQHQIIKQYCKKDGPPATCLRLNNESSVETTN